MTTRTALRRDEVRVRVPATSANLGPGFDTLGLALSLHDELSVRVTDGPLSVEVEGEGAQEVPRDGSHLVVSSLRAALDLVGVEAPGLALRCRNVLPHGRGLGSSSAAIVGGLVLARGLLTDPSALTDAALLDLANRIEGHPDNVAPALLGGFLVCGTDDDGTAYAVPSPVADGISAVVLVPPDVVATTAARGLLPSAVPHADAARNAGRAALLVTALAHRPDQLLRATEDRLHQQHRGPAMPRTLALVDSLRADGVPAVVSGAGPTLLAFVGEAVGMDPRAVLDRAPAGWSAHHVEVAGPGATVLD
ncbi:homoserine kinase [Nocardioides sp. CFH 31398]|uniref:homoserine kinase n=1 Tax=Nocardioides sp. CFH 31398 TaxID=2919579 RepID=UPI001F055454|nr:homoserine kinase [Nocardioides sp. CFH 31398]MCH1868881.1 homoserine kinase [Nocardioides sp. CFH 31398]